MTLDEAIKHSEEVADVCEFEASKYDMSDSYESHVACQEGKCAEEHRQLAEWLKELKQLREQANGDLISRKAAIDTVMFECGEWTGLAKEISKQLRQLPSVEKTAEWIDLGVTDEWFGAVGNCSNCGNNNLVGFKYCINCGAKMKGVEE